MRHRKQSKNFSYKNAARLARVRNQATSLVLYEKITTTVTRARALKSVVEKLVTIAKANNLAARRRLNAYLLTRGAVRKLVEELGPRYSERKGGYTRSIKLGTRKGDGAPIAQVELL